MKDLKIKVNNEAESKEAQELLFKLNLEKSNWSNFILPKFVATRIAENKFSDYMLGDHGMYKYKETTLAELRAMVKPMKEYLIPSRNYEYILTDAREALEPHAKDWICIPKGADFYVKSKFFEDSLFFCKDNLGIIETFDTVKENSWHQESTLTTPNLSNNYDILWQRPTQPEALPFIDDNPQSLNEQYAEIEQVRQAIKVKSGSDSDHALDSMSFGIMGAGAAQAIGSVDATLKERQSTYGNFEDVAFVTENIMSVLGRVRVNGLSELPNTHRMALYMIASKMARIVNGDFNHIDSWHDIGGYAKLIEDLVKENNNG